MAHLRRRWYRLVCMLVLAGLASCRDQPLAPAPPAETPEPAPSRLTPIGLVEVRLNAIGTDDFDASAGPPQGLSLNLSSPRNGDGSGDGSIQLDRISTGSFTEGTRSTGGQRYFTATFRVRNAQSDGTPYTSARTNLTLMAVRTATSKFHSAVKEVTRFDGTPADSAVAPQIVPTGTVALNDSLRMVGSFPDVLQVISDAEAAAVPLQSGVLEVFPWGFVVRNPNSASSRTLPANPAASQWDGTVTLAFRVPLQPSAAQDAYNITFLFMAMDDSETRVTESIEEQDSAAHTAARARALALNATTSTVLNGSPFTDYPGQRQICTARIAGPAGAPTRLINAPGMYSRVAVYGPGETLDPCAADFRGGTFTGAGQQLGLNVVYPVTLRAMDRYGNVRPVTDTVTLGANNPDVLPSLPAQTILASGTANANISFGSYGASATPRSFALVARSRRQNHGTVLRVGGIQRVWTAGGGTSAWHTGANWNVGAAPAALDTVVVNDVAATALYPQLFQNESVENVQVLDLTPGGHVPTISLNAFNLAVSGNVLTTNSGAIDNTSGSLLLNSLAGTVAGELPFLRVTGRYTLSGNVRARAPARIDAGRITDGSFRFQIESR